MEVVNWKQTIKSRIVASSFKFLHITFYWKTYFSPRQPEKLVYIYLDRPDKCVKKLVVVCCYCGSVPSQTFSLVENVAHLIAGPSAERWILPIRERGVDSDGMCRVYSVRHFVLGGSTCWSVFPPTILFLFFFFWCTRVLPRGVEHLVSIYTLEKGLLYPVFLSFSRYSFLPVGFIFVKGAGR